MSSANDTIAETFSLTADMTRSEWEAMAIAFNQASECRVQQVRAKLGGRGISVPAGLRR